MKLNGIKIFNKEWKWEIKQIDKTFPIQIETSDIEKIAFVAWWIVYRKSLKDKSLDKKKDIWIFGEMFSLIRTLSFNHVFYKDYRFDFFIPSSAINITPLLVQVEIMKVEDFPLPTSSIDLTIRKRER